MPGRYRHICLVDIDTSAWRYRYMCLGTNLEALLLLQTIGSLDLYLESQRLELSCQRCNDLQQKRRISKRDLFAKET